MFNFGMRGQSGSGNTPTDSAPAPGESSGVVPVPAPAPAPATPVIPDKPDLEFFNNLVSKSPKSDTPGVVPSITKEILTPENMKKIVATQSFTQHISPETAEKLKNGDASAIMSAMEDVARAAYSTALTQSGAIVDSILEQHGATLQHNIERDITASKNLDAITSGIPNVDQPVVKAGAELISSQLRVQFPDASPEQIRNMTQNYFVELAEAMNPKPQPVVKPQDQPINWMEYAGFKKP